MSLVFVQNQPPPKYPEDPIVNGQAARIDPTTLSWEVREELAELAEALQHGRLTPWKSEGFYRKRGYRIVFLDAKKTAESNSAANCTSQRISLTKVIQLVDDPNFENRAPVRVLLEIGGFL